MKTQRRKSTGTERAFVFSHHTDGSHSSGVEDIPTYPPCPEGVALRALRRELGLTLRDAARALGCGIVDALLEECARLRAEVAALRGAMRLPVVSRHRASPPPTCEGTRRARLLHALSLDWQTTSAIARSISASTQSVAADLRLLARERVVDCAKAPAGGIVWRLL